MAREDSSYLIGQFIDSLISPPASRQYGKTILVDIINEEKIIYVYAEIPSVSRENIDVDFFNNKLTIGVKKDRTYAQPSVSEIGYGRYERSITLPICITRQDTVSVSLTNGILEIKINKLIEEENRFSVRVA